MLPAISQVSMQEYASDNTQYKSSPNEDQTKAGVVPLDTLPAAWWNWLWSMVTKNNNGSLLAIEDIRAEFTSVLTNAGLTPSASQTNQLLNSILTIVRRAPSFDALGNAIKGTVISSSAAYSVSVDDETGQMTVNALSDWTDADGSVKEYITQKGSITTITTYTDESLATAFNAGTRLILIKIADYDGLLGVWTLIENTGAGTYQGTFVGAGSIRYTFTVSGTAGSYTVAQNPTSTISGTTNTTSPTVTGFPVIQVSANTYASLLDQIKAVIACAGWIHITLNVGSGESPTSADSSGVVLPGIYQGMANLNVLTRGTSAWATAPMSAVTGNGGFLLRIYGHITSNIDGNLSYANGVRLEIRKVTQGGIYLVTEYTEAALTKAFNSGASYIYIRPYYMAYPAGDAYALIPNLGATQYRGQFEGAWTQRYAFTVSGTPGTYAVQIDPPDTSSSAAWGPWNDRVKTVYAELDPDGDTSLKPYLDGCIEEGAGQIICELQITGNVLAIDGEYVPEGHYRGVFARGLPATSGEYCTMRAYFGSTGGAALGFTATYTYSISVYENRIQWNESSITYSDLIGLPSGGSTQHTKSFSIDGAVYPQVYIRIEATESFADDTAVHVDVTGESSEMNLSVSRPLISFDIHSGGTSLQNVACGEAISPIARVHARIRTDTTSVGVTTTVALFMRDTLEWEAAHTEPYGNYKVRITYTDPVTSAVARGLAYSVSSWNGTYSYPLPLYSRSSNHLRTRTVPGISISADNWFRVVYTVTAVSVSSSPLNWLQLSGVSLMIEIYGTVGSTTRLLTGNFVTYGVYNNTISSDNPDMRMVVLLQRNSPDNATYTPTPFLVFMLINPDNSSVDIYVCPFATLSNAKMVLQIECPELGRWPSGVMKLESVSESDAHAYMTAVSEHNNLYQDTYLFALE